MITDASEEPAVSIFRVDEHEDSKVTLRKIQWKINVSITMRGLTTLIKW
jgi:hypothetical protein